MANFDHFGVFCEFLHVILQLICKYTPLFCMAFCSVYAIFASIITLNN